VVARRGGGRAKLEPELERKPNLCAKTIYNYTAFHRKLLFWSLIIQASMDNQAPKKETFDEKRYT
jgi:hypothetical protein